MHGDGNQTRDFVYIDDVVDALYAAAITPNINRTIINVGSGEETSINNLIAAIGDVTGRRPDVIYNPQQSGGIGRLVADLRQAQQLLGYQPHVKLVQGLQQLLRLDPRFAHRAASTRGARPGSSGGWLR